MSTLFALSSGHVALNIAMGCKGFAPLYLVKDRTFLDPSITPPSAAILGTTFDSLLAKQDPLAHAIMFMLFLSKYVVVRLNIELNTLRT